MVLASIGSYSDTGDVYSSNDYVSGKYKNVKFEQCDVHFWKRGIIWILNLFWVLLLLLY